MKKLTLISLLVLAFAIGASAQEAAVVPDGPPAYRLAGYATLGSLDPGVLQDGGPFSVAAGFERFVVKDFAAGVEFNQTFGPEAVSAIHSTAKWYFKRDGKFEAFAIGRYGSELDQPDIAAFGGGANFFGLPKVPENLGVTFEIRDDFDLDNGNQSGAVRVGVVYRF